LKVIINDEVIDIAKGHNNFFHAVILFFHHIKVEEKGVLGRTNLTLSGLNILAMLEST
jgi:hypothetical protein